MSIAREPGNLRQRDSRARVLWWAVGLGLVVGTMLLVVAWLATVPTASARQSPRPAAAQTDPGETARRNVGHEPNSRLAQVEIEERRLRVAPPRPTRPEPIAKPAAVPVRKRELSTPPPRPPARAPQPVKPAPTAAARPAADLKQPEAGEKIDSALEPEERPEARYPEDAAADGVTGKVRVKVVVDPRGQVEDALVVRSSGDDRLDRAAEEAVRRWRYRPARRSGKSVTATDYVEVEFFRKADEAVED